METTMGNSDVPMPRSEPTSTSITPQIAYVVLTMDKRSMPCSITAGSAE